MITYVYFLIILIIYSPYCHSAITEWYLGLHGGLTSLTGSHNYANAGDGDKKDENQNQRAQENVNLENSTISTTRKVLEAHNPNKNVATSQTHTVAAGGPPPPPPPPPPPASSSSAVNPDGSPRIHILLSHPPGMAVPSPDTPPQSMACTSPGSIPVSSYNKPNTPPAPKQNGNHGSTPHYNGNISFNERTSLYGVHLGFLNRFNNYNQYVIGGELYCNFSNLKTVKDLKVNGRAPEGKFSVRNPYTVGFAVMGGYFISPRSLIYTRFGLEMNKFINEYYNLNFVGSTAPYKGNPMRERYNFSLRGLAPGMGMKFTTGKKTDVSMEYTYSMMQKIHLRSDQVTINSVNRGYLFQPNQHRFLLKLSYVIK